MQGEQSPDSLLLTRGAATRWPVMIAATVAYVLVVLSAFVYTLTGTAVSAVALALLGVALAVYTAGRVGVREQPRLGGQARLLQQRYQRLAFASAGAVYVVLVAGALTTERGALWDCLTLPLCPTNSDLALIAVAHRLLAALATIMIAVLAWQTWRLQAAPVIRRAAGWALGLMIFQNLIGLVQIVLVREGSNAFVMPARLSHLAIGAATWGILVILAVLVQRIPLPQAALRSAPRPRATPADDATERVAQPSKFKDYLSLTKPRVITLLIFTTLAAMFITPEGAPSFGLVFWTMLGGWLMPSGAHALNCYFDRDIDLKMGRTGRRPLPSNRIPAWHALVLGIVLAVVAFAVLAVFVNLLTAVLALAGFFYYVLIYTVWLKRNSPSNIVIGGGAGAFPPLIGWAAVTGDVSLSALLLFAIIFYWTPPHFWALALIRSKDYANANVPMLPVVAGEDETKRQILLYTVMMVALTLILTPLNIMGLPYLLMALVFGGLFTHYALRLQREGTTAAAWALYRYSLLYLALLFAAMMIDRLAFG